MGYCYTFYNPEKDFEVIDSGKFVGMPMYQQDFPVKIPMVFGTISEYGYSDMKCNDPYNCTGIIDRNLAEEIQKYMNINNTIFTDWMDKYHIDSIVFRIT